MTQPIEIKLPNGLIICMMPYDAPNTLFNKARGGSTAQAETQDQLWTRFIHALATTDLAALRKVYESSMPAPRPTRVEAHVGPARPAFPTPTEVKK